MISFQSLMQSVQQSIHSAAQAVESAGFKHIDKFFDPIKNENSIENQKKSQKLKDAHAAINNGDIDEANSLLKELNESELNENKINPEDDIIYRPKMVAMAFPSQSDDGNIDSTVVNVPLITLCPISSPRIKEVKFSAELEVTTNDKDELQVAFRPAQVTGGEHTITKNSTNTKIEISLIGHEPPEGLQKIIEGYEKSLRAQIPG
ncbi:MAG: DUF2589 domain-containing protein [Saccharospirillaceae bacterium]|nr:DUF2589 domain-containing protein [Pseudomonadales bacterium]NRB80824.1 DUF2589 domain-containing protein [Saccharospirillaceae bacterium]